MEYTCKSDKKNVNKFEFITSLIGAILAAVLNLGTLLLTIFISLSIFQDIKISDYIVVDSQVLSSTNMNYKVQYTIDNKTYESELFAFEGNHKGDIIPIKVNPNDKKDIYYAENNELTSKVIFLIILLFVLVTGIASGKNYLSNIYRYIKSQKI